MQRINEEERVCGPVVFSRERHRQSLAHRLVQSILAREGEAHWAFLTDAMPAACLT